MKALLVPAALAIVLGAGVASSPAEAAGCIKGAVVGAVAGHFVGHSALGAGAGCVVGRHNANRRIDERDRAYEPDNNYNPRVSGYQRPQPFNGSDPRAYDQRGVNYDNR